jgi:hypothetical protein
VNATTLLALAAIAYFVMNRRPSGDAPSGATSSANVDAQMIVDPVAPMTNNVLPVVGTDNAPSAYAPSTLVNPAPAPSNAVPELPTTAPANIPAWEPRYYDGVIQNAPPQHGQRMLEQHILHETGVERPETYPPPTDREMMGFVNMYGSIEALLKYKLANRYHAAGMYQLEYRLPIKHWNWLKGGRALTPDLVNIDRQVSWQEYIDLLTEHGFLIEDQYGNLGRVGRWVRRLDPRVWAV